MKLFKRKFTFLFKSGKEIHFRADNVKVTSRSNELTAYEIEGGPKKLLYVRIDDLSAVLMH